MKILLVEDDARMAAFISEGLRREGWSVEHADDGHKGLFAALEQPFDAAIVDLMLPKMDGLSLVKSVRASNKHLPILILSAKSGVDDRVALLRAGCDDYLVKPFAFSELMARLEAIMRRNAAIDNATGELAIADLRLLPDRRKVYRGDDEITLQPLEFALLQFLMRNSPRVVSKTMIMEYVWDYHFDPSTNVVEACVCRIREKIDRNYPNKLIHTVRGFGYVAEARPE